MRNLIKVRGKGRKAEQKGQGRAVCGGVRRCDHCHLPSEEVPYFIIYGRLSVEVSSGLELA